MKIISCQQNNASRLHNKYGIQTWKHSGAGIMEQIIQIPKKRCNFFKKHYRHRARTSRNTSAYLRSLVQPNPLTRKVFSKFLSFYLFSCHYLPKFSNRTTVPDAAATGQYDIFQLVDRALVVSSKHRSIEKRGRRVAAGGRRRGRFQAGRGGARRGEAGRGGARRWRSVGRERSDDWRKRTELLGDKVSGVKNVTERRSEEIKHWVGDKTCSRGRGMEVRAGLERKREGEGMSGRTGDMTCQWGEGWGTAAGGIRKASSQLHRRPAIGTSLTPDTCAEKFESFEFFCSRIRAFRGHWFNRPTGSAVARPSSRDWTVGQAGQTPWGAADTVRPPCTLQRWTIWPDSGYMSRKKSKA